MEDSIYSFGKRPNSGTGAKYDLSKFGQPFLPSVEELYAPTNSLYDLFNTNGGNGMGFGARGGSGLQAPTSFGAMPGAGGQGGGGMFSGLGKSLRDSGFLGSTDTNTGIKTDGFGGLALGAGQGLLSAFMGMKQYGLAKKTLAQNQKVFDMNYNAQRQTTNTRLEDRQQQRMLMSPTTATPVEEYMNKNRIK